MIRVLVMIAVAGFVLAIVTIPAAFAIGGPDFIARGGWKWASDKHWDWNWDPDDDQHWEESWSAADSVETTRTLEWSGEDRLDIEIPADVRYVQSAGPARVTVTGPKRLVDRVAVHGDSLRYEDEARRYGRTRLTVVMQAPSVTSFRLAGRSTLAIEGYDQGRLKLDVAGSAEVTGVGRTDLLELDVAGSGDVDLGSLKAKGANVDIAGAADAVIAPTDWAKLDISGRGDVRLLTQPPKLETDVSGAGRVRMGGAAGEEAPSAQTPPSPPAKGAKL